MISVKILSMTTVLTILNLYYILTSVFSHFCKYKSVLEFEHFFEFLQAQISS